MDTLNNNYWADLYIKHKTGWDIGYISTPLRLYIDQIKNKNLKVLIPGAGNSYEAEYLWNNGFKNIYILDFVEQALKNFTNRVPDFPKDQLINSDFFKLNDRFDLILEQTFFCALQPKFRHKYAKQMDQLLRSNGKLVGLFFNFELTTDGPPFGGSLIEYQLLFKQVFKIKILEPAINSIKERQGTELFFIFEKKS
nr:methyltransferase domain-containing protein [Winogradskyella wichelsiae]